MDYEACFEEAFSNLRTEGNYRTFADLERQSGQFPKAKHHCKDGMSDVTVWCWL